MHLGIAAYSYREELKTGELTLEDLIELARELGCDGMELTAYYFPTTEREYLFELKRHALRNGIDVAGTAVGSRFTYPDPERRRQQVAMAREWIDHSVHLGAPCLRIFAGGTPEGVSEEDARGWAVACMRELAGYAGDRGVVLALENHGGITSTADQVIRLVEAVDSPWLAVNLDTGNYREEPLDSIRRTAPYAVTAHVKSQLRDVEGSRRPADLEGIITALAGAGYCGYLNIEYEAAEPATTAVPDFAARLRRLLDAVRSA